MICPPGLCAHGAYSALKQEVNDAGLELEVIESVNIHETSSWPAHRDEYIDNYRQTVARLGQAGSRSSATTSSGVRLDPHGSGQAPFDGATVLAYDQSIIDRITDPQPLPTASNRCR